MEFDDEETPLNPPEVMPGTDKLTSWDDMPDATGHAVGEVRLEDELNVAEELVRDGIEVADTELRDAAEDLDEEGEEDVIEQ